MGELESREGVSAVLAHKRNDATLVSNRLLRYSSSHWETDWLSASASPEQRLVLRQGKTKSFQYYKIYSVRFLVKCSSFYANTTSYKSACVPVLHLSQLIRSWHVGTVQAWIRLCIYLEMLVLIFSQAFQI